MEEIVPAVPQVSQDDADHAPDEVVAPVVPGEGDNEYVISRAMLDTVATLDTIVRTETARLSAHDALDAVDMLRDRLLELEAGFRKTVRRSAAEAASIVASEPPQET